jgi:hypothetical protein
VPYKLGKHPPVHDRRTLKLKSYSGRDRASPPAHIDWGAAVNRWPSMLNESFGDCTVAAAGHMIQCWSANAGPREMIVPDAVIEGFYRSLTGSEAGWEDKGVSLLRTLKLWRSRGLHRQKLDAFLAVTPNDPKEAMHAISTFGGCYIGLALPDFAAHGNKIRTPWKIPPGRRAPPQNVNNGHCVVAVGYDDEALTVVTWGHIKRMSWQFYQAYSDEAFALLSPLWIVRTYGKAPPGFNMDQLKRDLREIGKRKP